MPEMSTVTEEATSRVVQTARWKLHYNDVGAGHPIIMLHGTGPGATGWSNFVQNVPALSANNRVILLDFPGWGGSEVFDCTGEYRADANAEAVKLLMDELGIEQATLVGNSMGGAAVMSFMARYPERISRAITMGSGLFSMPLLFRPAGPSEGIQVLIDTYQDPSPENFRRLVEIMVYDKSFYDEAIARARSRAALAEPAHLANWLKWRNAHPEGIHGGFEKQAAALGKSAVPALMIHGRDDRTVPMELTLRTAGLIPNARAVILNRCGHWAQVEHRDVFNKLVLDFISET